MTQNSAESVRELPFAWRVTRYDPAGRDAKGAYLSRSWTSIGDVGKDYGGIELTLGEYERVEAAYVQTFAAFATESGVETLVLREVDFAPDWVDTDGTVDLGGARRLLQAMLREEASCKLEARTGDFYVHVGFDLYMYLGSARACPAAVAEAVRLGLFVDSHWPSPMLSSGA